MRALFKDDIQKDQDIMRKFTKVEYTICLDSASVWLSDKGILVQIRVPIDELENIKIGFLRHGYFDFREYIASTSKF